MTKIDKLRVEHARALLATGDLPAKVLVGGMSRAP